MTFRKLTRPKPRYFAEFDLTSSGGLNGALGPILGGLGLLTRVEIGHISSDRTSRAPAGCGSGLMLAIRRRPKAE